MERPDGRPFDELRSITFLPHVAPHATGSVLIGFGKTRVICSACIEDGVPRWMKEQRVGGGWLTAEYTMLPYSTLNRKPRDISRGRVDGRSSEIQRLIGRSLRAVIDLKAIGPRTIWIDCDVLQADGGTRTASVTGACVACALAFEKLMGEGKIKKNPLKEKVAAVSAGVFKGTACLDLNYIEDRDATVDFNFVMTEGRQFVEMQGTGEEATFTDEELSAMTALGKKGIEELVSLQEKAIEEARLPADENQLKDLASFFGED
ncbi:MAG: ribonuclease PH [Verrucomicrobiota bacterium]